MQVRLQYPSQSNAFFQKASEVVRGNPIKSGLPTLLLKMGALQNFKIHEQPTAINHLAQLTAINHMAKSTLPQKRDGEDGMVSPKTKAQKKEEAILKAREWALKRKGGSESLSPKKKVAKSKEEEESDDVITNLPNIPAKKSRRSGAASDDVSDTESIGSRTRSRRRSVGGAKAAAATTTSTDFKSPPKGTRGRGRPRKTPKKVEPVAAEEQVVEEEKPTEQTPPVAEEEKKEAAAPEVE